MAKKGRSKKYPDPMANVSKEKLRQLAKAIEHIDGELAELRKDRAEYVKSAKENAIHGAALALCIKLAKQDSGARQIFLDCFDQYRADLSLDRMASELQPQQDIEDAIAAGDTAKPQANGAAKSNGKQAPKTRVISVAEAKPQVEPHGDELPPAA